MPLTKHEEEVLKRFCDRLALPGELVSAENVSIKRLISGGAPGARLLRETTLTGVGHVHVRHLDELSRGNKSERAAAISVNKASARETLVAVAAHFRHLVPRSEARFVPDSLVGSVTITMDGEHLTAFYDADAESRGSQVPGVARPLYEALAKFRRLEERAIPDLDAP